MPKTLDIRDIIEVQQLASQIANYWVMWDSYRNNWKNSIQEVRNYIFATDTTTTTNSKLPWSNKTTIPKICQIRDNLLANYEATMFPRRKWLDWEPASREDNDLDQTKKIKNYMLWVVEQPWFKQQIKKLLEDYIDAGNCFVMPEWVDETTDNGQMKTGFIGPRPVRLNPNDIVFNPTATSFSEAPKIIRSIMSIGEAKKWINRITKTPEQKAIAEAVFTQCMNERSNVSQMGPAQFSELDKQFAVDGFTSYHLYLSSNYVELLTFYGDLYDQQSNTLYENYMITIMDRNKVIFKAPHPYPLAEIPIFKTGWRQRQDNLWSMGPLDNLVGMQYRLDHIENMKADLVDLMTFPPLKITGVVGDFEWGPMEKIFVDGDGSDVELLVPQVNITQIELQIDRITALMEEMAGSPKEAMGFRTPGEKTAYEVQRLENAASRIFQAKVSQFEEQVIEPLLNSMLVYAKQYLTQTEISVVDNKYNTLDFATITTADLSANGRLKPIAARHFAEQATLIQNLNNFVGSGLYQDRDVNIHFSGLKLAKVVEELLELEDYELVTPFVRIAEEAEAQQLTNSTAETTTNTALAPSGMTPDDYSNPQGTPNQAQPQPQPTPSVGKTP